MIIELNPVDLLENTFAYAYRKSDFENAEVFKIRLVEHINKIKNVLDADIDNLSDEEFFKLLVSIYYIRLDNNDYLKLFSKKYNKNYTCIAIIPTTMTFTDICKEGRGNSFDWWEQKYQLQYMVAVSNEIKLDENKVYSKKEIKQLVSDNTIILLNQETKTIEEDELTFIEESVEYLPINFDFDENGNIMSGFILDNYDLYMEILREKFTKAKIYNDMQKYISYLRDDIKHIINCDDNISQLCKEYYEKENIKLIKDAEDVLTNSSEYHKIVEENAGNAIWLLGVSNPDYEVFDNYVLVHDMYIVGAVDYSEEIEGKDVGDEVALRGSIYKITEKSDKNLELEYIRKNDNYAAPVYENTSGLYWMNFSGDNGGYWFLSRWDKGYNYYIEALGIGEYIDYPSGEYEGYNWYFMGDSDCIDKEVLYHGDIYFDIDSELHAYLRSGPIYEAKPVDLIPYLSNDLGVERAAYEILGFFKLNELGEIESFVEMFVP